MVDEFSRLETNIGLALSFRVVPSDPCQLSWISVSCNLPAQVSRHMENRQVQSDHGAAAGRLGVLPVLVRLGTPVRPSRPSTFPSRLSHPVLLSRRMMLTKDKKPEQKDAGREVKEVIPPQRDTPKMFRAALKVAEQAGIEGTFAKLREPYKQEDGSQVRGDGPWMTDNQSVLWFKRVCPSQAPVPPPSPTHRRTPIRLPAFQDVDDTVSESADSSVVIRMTSRQAGEEVLLVEVTHGDADEKTEE